MKNIYKIAILVTSIFTYYSCEKDLNQYPNDTFSPETYYKTISDFELATKGMYSQFMESYDNSESYYGNNFLSLPDIMSDNVILAQAGRRSNQLYHEWRFTSNDPWYMMYAPYVIINRANLIIFNIDNLQDGVEKNNFLGEAKAARAMAYFDMLRIYSKIPTESTDANSSLGMPIVESTDPNIQIPRNTVSEAYAYVISELEAAKLLVNGDNGVGRFNINAVNALLSRVYLYAGQWQNAVNAANDVTTSIEPRSSFSGIWTDSNTDGVILKMDQNRTYDDIAIGVQWSQSVGNTIIPEYVMSYDLYSLYQSTDIRKSAYTLVAADEDGNLYNAIKKMFGETGQNNGKVDAKLLRSGEVYLNKAEAYYMLGGHESEALVALDVVRSNRYSNFVSPNETGAALLNAIKLERRLELFAEGHRFFDLKRWGESIQRSATYGEFFDGTGTPVPSAYLSLPAGSNKFQLPIPKDEINVFPGLEQNPGY